jgi:hypothetical protein
MPNTNNNMVDEDDKLQKPGIEEDEEYFKALLMDLFSSNGVSYVDNKTKDIDKENPNKNMSVYEDLIVIP